MKRNTLWIVLAAALAGCEQQSDGNKMSNPTNNSGQPTPPPLPTTPTNKAPAGFPVNLNLNVPAGQKDFRFNPPKPRRLDASGLAVSNQNQGCNNES
jgi:hypothetical protein